MSALEIVLLCLLFLFLVVGFFFAWYFYKKSISFSRPHSSNNETQMLEHLQKLRDEIIEMKTTKNTDTGNIETIRENIQKLNSLHTQNKEKLFDLSKKFTNLDFASQQSQEQTRSLTERIEEVRDIFSSNYRRGNLGEISLYFIVENIFGTDNEIVRRQYIMKNGKQPDLFLRSEQTGIPIDSKFPYDNFSKIINLEKNQHAYKQEVQILKKHIRNYIRDISEKYISVSDNAEQAIMYLPSQALFEFIHSEKEFDSVLHEALKKKVHLTSPNTLPAILRLILIYVRDTRQRKQASAMLKSIQSMSVEFNRFADRWSKFNRRIDGLFRDSKEFDTTTFKLQNKFRNIYEGKENRISEKNNESSSIDNSVLSKKSSSENNLK